jgi:hypothetical protein
VAASVEESAGIEPSSFLEVMKWRKQPQPQFGLQAYWVNAASIRVPSDYYYLAARGTALEVGEVTSRWASFVPAPGYGPVREVGIPESGLYYAVVVMPDGPQASGCVRDVLMRVSFGGTTVSEFLRVARVGQRQ